MGTLIPSRAHTQPRVRCESILGLGANQSAWVQCMAGHKTFIVSAYIYEGIMRYTKAVYIGPRHKTTPKRSRADYRVRVIPHYT